jgi:hypothetical protein
MGWCMIGPELLTNWTTVCYYVTAQLERPNRHKSQREKYVLLRAMNVTQKRRSEKGWMSVHDITSEAAAEIVESFLSHGRFVH